MVLQALEHALQINDKGIRNTAWKKGETVELYKGRKDAGDETPVLEFETSWASDHTCGRPTGC